MLRSSLLPVPSGGGDQFASKFMSRPRLSNFEVHQRVHVTNHDRQHHSSRWTLLHSSDGHPALVAHESPERFDRSQHGRPHDDAPD